MKYYLIEIAEGDAKIKGEGIHEYNSRNEAIANRVQYRNRINELEA